MAMNKILPTILLWLRLNPGKEPREFKAPKTEEERVEQKVSRCLRHLRGKAELGKLPNDVDDQLTKVRLKAPCSEGGAGDEVGRWGVYPIFGRLGSGRIATFHPRFFCL